MACSEFAPRLGADRAVILGRKRKRQRTGIDLVCQFLCTFICKVTGNGCLAVRDHCVDRRCRDHGVVHPDGDLSLGLIQLRGCLIELFCTAVVQIQGNHPGDVSGGVILGTAGRCLCHVRTGQHDIARRNGVAVFIGGGVCTLAEGQFCGLAQFLDSLFRIEVLFACLPRKTHDNTIALVVQIRFAVADVLVCQTQLDGLQCCIHLFLRCIHIARRFKGHVYAALDVDAETDIIHPVNIGLYHITKLGMHAENGGERKQSDYGKYNEENGFFTFLTI
mgnify:CR=1 FL=1